MAFIPGDGGGGGSNSDMFSVTPQLLQQAAPTYARAAQDITTLEQALVNTVQMAGGDMFLLLEFAQLASRLEQLQARIDAAMQCATIGLNRVSTALQIASQEYMDTDQQVSTNFTRIENDTNQTNLPPITLPGINVPGGKPGSVPPTKPEQPGIQNPLPGQNPLKPVVPHPIIPIEPVI